MQSWLSEWTKTRHRLLGAARCVLCHETAAAGGLCTGCADDLACLRQDGRHRCPGCLAFSVGGVYCGHCQQRPPAADGVFAGYDYQPPLQTMLHAFKYQGHSSLLPALGGLLLAHPPPCLADWAPDAVLAVPLSRARLLQRGFNQSALLAEMVARAHHWPLLPAAAVTRRQRPPQSTLSRAQRRQNVRGVFRVRADVKNRNLLLIDDVVTTGATIQELAKSLKRAGAHRVWVWALAHPQ